MIVVHIIYKDIFYNPFYIYIIKTHQNTDVKVDLITTCSQVEISQ
jgi:hypothetical protein